MTPSVVSILCTGNRLDDLGFESQKEQKMFLFSKLGAVRSTQLPTNIYRFFFLREADHSPPFSSEVKKEWCYTTTCLYDVYKGNFNFIAFIYIALTGQRKGTGYSTCLESNKPSTSLR